MADIGIIGGKSSADGQAAAKYAIVSGGGRGASNVLAKPAAEGLSAEGAVAEVVRLARTFSH